MPRSATERPGVAPRALSRVAETSSESSQQEARATATGGKVVQFPQVRQEQPIELPQFKHL